MEHEEKGIKKRERWQELAELAEKEQDPKNLIALIIELNKILDERTNLPKTLKP